MLVRDKHTKLKWESVTNQLPNGVIQGGISAQKKPLFICRCSVKNVYKVGSVITFQLCLSVRVVLAFFNFEIAGGRKRCLCHLLRR